MLDEFILEQLNAVEDEYLSLSERLEKLNQAEEDIQRTINDYLSEDDLGMEVFSPRSNSGPIKEKITEAQKRMEEIRLSLVDVSDQIARNREKEERYQMMLNEARMTGIKDTKEDLQTQQYSGQDNAGETGSELEDNKNEHKEELKEILKRIEKCINLVNHDRNKCKAELKNLKYYLKALLTEDMG